MTVKCNKGLSVYSLRGRDCTPQRTMSWLLLYSSMSWTFFSPHWNVILFQTWNACRSTLCGVLVVSGLVFWLGMYKVVQIWPGLIVCKQVTVCPGLPYTRPGCQEASSQQLQLLNPLGPTLTALPLSVSVFARSPLATHQRQRVAVAVCHWP